jgi:hypothetical protein
MKAAASATGLTPPIDPWKSLETASAVGVLPWSSFHYRRVSPTDLKKAD